MFNLGQSIVGILAYQLTFVNANPDAQRLLEDLANGYNIVVRPVSDPREKIILKLGLKLSQIADIDERNQIMTTNVWVRHEWYDHKLVWNPLHYGNITKVNIPSTNIWLADVVLYNNADGDYQITTKTKATVFYDGKIIWEPPMIYKSYCAIDIEYYPFDIQDCYMKFGTWSFNGELIVMEHINKNHSIPELSEADIKKDGASYKLYSVEMGIDMSDYYDSVEWDILSIPAQKNIKYYECCPEPYYDIYFNITIRRKTLFYTVNLIIPCVIISFLSVLVFYLPSSSGEKIALGIYVLVALLVFYLLLIELIPPTSLVIPLLGKYLLFTLILVNLSILLTIFVLNLHHRKPNTHKMPIWMKRVFIEILPKMLMIERPKIDPDLKINTFNSASFQTSNINLSETSMSNFAEKKSIYDPNNNLDLSIADGDAKRYNAPLTASEKKRLVKIAEKHFRRYPVAIQNALKGMKYLHECLKKETADRVEMDDWKYAAMVIDRLLLWIFLAAFFIGTFGILLKAPSIYDERRALRKSDFF